MKEEKYLVFSQKGRIKEWLNKLFVVYKKFTFAAGKCMLLFDLSQDRCADVGQERNVKLIFVVAKQILISPLKMNARFSK